VVVVGAAAGLVAAWVAAGSTGLLGQPLQVALTWLALLIAAVAVRPRFKPFLALVVGVLLLLPLFVQPASWHALFTVVAFLALLASGSRGHTRRMLLICCLAALTLAVFRFAQHSLPTVWWLSDWVGGRLGDAVSYVTGQSVRIGSTFAGLDFLVLMAAFYGGWLVSIDRLRIADALFAAAAIIVGHFVYLIVVAHAADLTSLLPERPEPVSDNPYVPPAFSWADPLHQWVPWNLPFLAAAIHTTLAVLMMRWAVWQPTADAPAAPARWNFETFSRWGWSPSLLAIVLAAFLPAVGTLTITPCNLGDKTLVANLQGQLDWRRPQHDSYGQQSAGMFGMLPVLVDSLGGQLQRSSNLALEDLAAADVLVLLHPRTPLPAEQSQRIWQYVRQGGSL
jgi:hypothetical protein